MQVVQKHGKVYAELTEDEMKDGEKKAQDLTDKACAKIDAVCADKEKEIMTI